MKELDLATAMTEKHPTPDWNYWARMPGWRYAEGAALLIQLDPLNQEQLKADPEYQRLEHLLKRAWNMEELESPMRPHNFIEWAISNGISIPEPLRDAVAKGEPLQNWKKRALKYKRQLKNFKSKYTNADEVPPKSLKSLFSIILAIAEDKYGYSPNKNTSAAANIASTLARKGFSSPKEETIRDWLKEAHEALRL
jgi:hypothetical protein